MIDTSLALSAIALVVSVVALALSSYLAARQIRLLSQANHIGPFVQLMAEFRDAAFHERYRYVVQKFQIEYPPELGFGIFELPEPARSTVIDITYYFQNCAAFISFGLLDETRIMAMLHVRFISVWDAIRPYVLAERQKNPTAGKYLLTSLERFAAYAKSQTEEQAISILETNTKSSSSQATHT